MKRTSTTPRLTESEELLPAGGRERRDHRSRRGGDPLLPRETERPYLDSPGFDPSDARPTAFME